MHKNGNQLASDHLLSFEETDRRIWQLGAEIFIPGAASRLVTKAQVDQMIGGGLEVISCGANVPFIDDMIFFGETAMYADNLVSVIPDFIANCGMARVFAYLMQENATLTDEAIFSDVSSTIKEALNKTYTINSALNKISTTSLHSALKKLLN